MDSTSTKTLQSKSQAPARILYVTTVPITLTSFLIPFAGCFKVRGARVDCASAGASTYGGLSAFDSCYDISWSRSLSSFLGYKSCEEQLFKILDEVDYDIVHVHTPIAAYMTRKACARWKAHHNSSKPSVIYTAHGFHFYQGQSSRLQHFLFRTLEKRALPWTDALVVMNNEDEQAARALRDTKAATHIERIDGIGFDFESYDSLRRAHAERANITDSPEPTNQRTTQLCIIAEHNQNKDISLLFHALALIERQSASPYHLSVVGSGPLTDTLKDLAAALGIDKHLTFTGQINRAELDNIIKNTDIGVLVSKREGLPRSLMEFCAAGVTIAGTTTRGIVDEVRDPRALAEDRTPESVAKMLQELIENPKLRDAIAQAQYDYAKQHFDLPQILSAYEKLYTHYL